MTLQGCFIAAGSRFPFVARPRLLRRTDLGTPVCLVAQRGEEFDAAGGNSYSAYSGWTLLEKETREARNETLAKQQEKEKSVRLFRVGDRVKILTVDGSGAPDSCVGRLGTVEVEGVWPRVRPDNHSSNYCFREEQVTSGAAALEELVRKANEGTEASKLLTEKYADLVEEREPGGVWGRPGGGFEAIYTSFRIKPQPPKLMPSFKLPDAGFAVSMPDKDTVKVGCKQFDVKALAYSLDQLCRHSRHSAASGCPPTQLFASKDGVHFGADKVSWRDADVFLAALEAWQKSQKEAA